MSGRTRECKKCGQQVGVTATGHLRAHDCPHGLVCVLPYAERKHTKAAHCFECHKALAQLPLFR